MVLYVVVAVFVAIMVFFVNLIFLCRIELLNKNKIFNIFVFSVMVSVSFPMVLNGFMKISISSNFSLALFTSIITALVLIVIASLIISGMSDDKKTGGTIVFWSVGNVFRNMKKRHYLKGTIVGGATEFIEIKEPPSSTQGKNILEKSVDTDKNTDTMGIETFYNGSLFLDDFLAIQSANKTKGCSSEFTDNPNNASCYSSSDSTEDNENGSFIDDYEVFEDYFEEEVLIEYLQVESKYGSANAQMAENREVDVVSPVYDKLDSDGVLQKKSSNLSEDEYLDSSLDIVFNEINSGDVGQQQNCEEYVTIEGDFTCNNELENTDEVFELVAAHMDEPGINANVADIERSQFAISKTVDEIIDEAFFLKENDDFEGAILNYYYALENGPEDDVVFWIVLDICVLYKQLGQVELAREVLSSYISEYGEFMDQTVRHEIELNLQ